MSRPRRQPTNPFGEEDESEYVNPFEARRGGRSAVGDRPGGGREGGGMRRRPIARDTGGTTNPFGNDDDDGGEAPPKPPPRQLSPRTSSTTADSHQGRSGGSRVRGSYGGAQRRPPSGGPTPGPSSSTNPFEGDSERPVPVRRARTAAAGDGRGGNPFDSDPQQQQQKGGDVRGLLNRANRRPSSGALSDVDAAATATATATGPGSTPSGSSGDGSAPRPASILRRSKTADEVANANPVPAEPRPWEEGTGGPSTTHDDPKTKKDAKVGGGIKDRLTGQGKRRNVKTKAKRWPYDDYHKEQQKQYDAASKKSVNTYANDGPDSSFYERPDQLPSIKEAVSDLGLIDFEKKAEERAINIVSTWLYDAGLIDELLVNGAVGPALANSSGPSLDIGAGDGFEGIEVGVRGFPLGGADGALKMDKEIEKLRAGAQQELGLINARLNDGVAASGAEVQELVSAVTQTKEDLGKLRELCTYITDSASSGLAGAAPSSGVRGGEDEFILTRYPRLKAAINARRNLFRCFRELDFFSHIPSTCDRLRDDLHSGEWTEDEWDSIRNVCMDHIELEILLVEAEAGMKAMFEEGDVSSKAGRRQMMAQAPASSVALRKQMRNKKMNTSRGAASYEMVDRFLARHVKNVWELGDEIRMRILHGIGSSFELALNNPSGMVALVEAVEVYERANEQYKSLREDEDNENSALHFTDMRAAALAQIYQDFELRGLEVFRAIHMQAADIADSEEGLNAQFNGVLRAATELVAEIELVRSDIAPCFPPHWAIEVLWSSCVSHVCSNQIIQQIGGPDGQALPDLNVTQLLDLVAWIELYRETIEEMFPAVASMHETQKAADFEKKPDLFASSGKEVDIKTATDNLAWVNNMLWEVHRLAQEEFLVRTRMQSEEWLQQAYDADHSKQQSAQGKLTTSLPEDVFSLANVQLKTLQEHLSKTSEALCMSTCLIFSMMRSKQIHARDRFIQDLETSCAASNDFARMGERCEESLQELIDECEFSEEAQQMLEVSCNELLSMYSADAVYAAQSTHIYIFEPINEAIGNELFGEDWEQNLTQNELALTLTRTLEDFYADLEHFIDEFMLKKAVDSLVKSTVVFYVKCLLLNAEKHRDNRNSYFGSNRKALDRISGDIKVLQEYFDGLSEDMPALKKVIEVEFDFLTTIYELMCIAAGLSNSDASDFILVMHKRIRDIDLTKNAVGDLWHLVNPTEERTVWELVESMEDTLLAVAPTDITQAQQAQDRSQVSGLRMDEMMAMVYLDSRRRRKVKPGAVERLRTAWGDGLDGETGEGNSDTLKNAA